MIARATLDLFDEIIARLPELAPPESLVPADAPAAPDAPFLAPQALPPDPERIAIVAVIDHAIPFAHRLLTTVTGHSRVAAIWLQDAPARDHRDDIAFGQELRGTMIDELRAQGGDIYRRLGLIEPGGGRAASWLRAGSHGAAVAALAAGFDPADPAGLCHPLIAVSLPDFCVADTSGSFSALFIQAAVVFVIARARALAAEISRAAGRAVRPPLVVNLSMGLTAGARDGSSLIAALQDAISATPEAGLGPVHFTLPTGNSRQAQARAVLSPGQSIDWLLPPDDRTPSAVEFWGPPIRGAAAPIALHLGLPGGPSVATGFGAGGGVVDLRDDAGRVIARLVHQSRNCGGGLRRACMTLIAAPTLPAGAGDTWAPPGVWNLRLDPGYPSDCEVAVQRDDSLPGFRRRGRPSRLVSPAYARRDDGGGWPGADPDPCASPIRRNGTASSYAGGSRQIRVGATMRRPAGALAPYSALLGDGAPGDLTAPGDTSAALRGLILPGLSGAMQRLSGTSLSAPQVARWLATELVAGRPLGDRAAIVAAARARSEVPRDCPDLGLLGRPSWRMA